MILTLWITLVSLSLVMVIIGFARPENSEQALIGFFFLFLLSFSIINDDLQYKTGNFNESTYYVYGDNFSGYHWDYVEPQPPPKFNAAYIFHTEKTISVEYVSFGNHNIGYWLAVASAVGMASVLLGLKKTKWGQE